MKKPKLNPKALPGSRKVQFFPFVFVEITSLRFVTDAPTDDE